MDSHNRIFRFQRDCDSTVTLQITANITVMARLADGWYLPEMLDEVMRTMMRLRIGTPIWTWYATLGFVILSRLGTRSNVWVNPNRRG
ncbi:hypothetical protein ABKA04_007875 [Annulohypoxylon sp. FPYF3050]